jgi:hypothetical protein
LLPCFSSSLRRPRFSPQRSLLPPSFYFVGGRGEVWVRRLGDTGV